MDAPMNNVQQNTDSPLKTKQITVCVEGYNTNLLCSHFEDRLFIIVTQYNKIGTLVEVTRDVVLEEMSASRPSYSSRVLLGVDEPLTHVIAKNLLSKLDSTKPVLLSMSLKDTSPKTVQGLSEAVKGVVG